MILTKEMFLNHLYGGTDEPEFKIIDVFVCKLRKKLTRATAGSHYIDTIWGRGYSSGIPGTRSRLPICHLRHRFGMTQLDGAGFENRGRYPRTPAPFAFHLLEDGRGPARRLPCQGACRSPAA
jgi:hypothetical protein